MKEGQNNLRKTTMRFHKAIQDVKTGTVLFFIPDSKDVAEKEGVFRRQIVQQLIAYSNMYDSYDRAIDEVQRYLQAMIHHYPEEAELIRRVADEAGAEFLKVVEEAKARALRTTIERGEMFLKIKRISGGK